MGFKEIFYGFSVLSHWVWPPVDETGVYRSCKDSSVVLLSSFSLVDQKSRQTMCVEDVVVGAIGGVVAVHRWKSVVVVVGMLDAFQS